MLKKILFFTFSGVFLGTSLLFAANGTVKITKPADGSNVDSKMKFNMDFEVNAGPEGDHVHLYVDGKKVGVIHKLKGSAEVGPLSAGKHKVCLEVNTKAHMPIGVEGCINVTAK